MGQRPAPAPNGFFGHFAVNSARLGPAARGRLRSSPILLNAAHLRFNFAGPKDADLRVALYAGGKVVKTATSIGVMQTVVWDLGEFADQFVELGIEDDSVHAGLTVDEFVVY
jgi:hypothetical protein